MSGWPNRLLQDRVCSKQAARPPGLSTRTISAMPAAGSGRYMSTAPLGRRSSPHGPGRSPNPPGTLGPAGRPRSRRHTRGRARCLRRAASMSGVWPGRHGPSPGARSAGDVSAGLRARPLRIASWRWTRCARAAPSSSAFTSRSPKTRPASSHRRAASMSRSKRALKLPADRSTWRSSRFRRSAGIACVWPATRLQSILPYVGTC